MERKIAETAGGIVTAIVLTVVSLIASGCHATIGTPSAIREYHRGLNGMISEGKATPDVRGAYWQNQDLHDGLRLGGVK